MGQGQRARLQDGLCSGGDALGVSFLRNCSFVSLAAKSLGRAYVNGPGAMVLGEHQC